MTIEINEKKVNESKNKHFEVIVDNRYKYFGKQSNLKFDKNIFLYSLSNEEILKTNYYGKKKILSVGILIVFSLLLYLVLFAFKIDTEIIEILMVIIWIISVLLFNKGTNKVCKVVNGKEEEKGIFSFKSLGFLDSFYNIETSEINIKVHSISIKDFQYIIFFHEEKQISQVNKKNVDVNSRDNYIMYVLDEYKNLEELLIMFVIYFDNFEYGKYREEFTYKWTYGKYNKKYDIDWVKNNFNG